MRTMANNVFYSMVVYFLHFITGILDFICKSKRLYTFFDDEGREIDEDVSTLPC